MIECLTALVLVSVASLLLVGTSASVSTLGDDALQMGRAQREQGNAAGRALLAPCDSVAASAATTRWPTPRLRIDEALTSSNAMHRQRVHVRWRVSALAKSGLRELQVSSAGRCR